MPIILDQIDLQTNDESAVLRMTGVEKFADGSGYKCELSVHSRGFSCCRPFFFDDSHLPGAVASLRSMDAGIPGEAIIKGEWDQDYIRIASNDMGHVFVVGELMEHSDLAQSLKFAFRTDQTVLRSLIADLQRLLDA